MNHPEVGGAATSMTNRESVGRGNHLPVILISLFVLLTLLIYSNRHPFFHEESRRAIVAQEMMVKGEYIVPTIFQHPYFKKPPAHNWLIVLASLPFGEVTGFSARAISSLALAAAALAVYLLLLRVAPRRALLGFLITIGNALMLFEYGNKVEPDMLVTALCIMAFAVYLPDPRRPWRFVLSAMLVGLGILTKGVSPLFFYPPLLVHAVMHEQARGRRLAGLLGHALASLLLPAVWVGLYCAQGDIMDLTRVLGSEVSARASGEVLALCKHLVSFPLRILLLWLPWPLVLWFGNRRSEFREAPLYRISLYGFLIALTIFTIMPGAVDRYLLPAFPLLAIVLALHIDPDRIPRAWIQRAFLGLGAAAGLFGGAYFIREGRWPEGIILLLAAGYAVREGLTAKRRLLRFAATVILLLLTVQQHGLYNYRALQRRDLKPEAERVVSHMTDETAPLVISDAVSYTTQFFKTGIFLQQLLDHPLYRRKNFTENQFGSWYFLTVPERLAPDGREVMRFRHGDGAESTLILQYIDGKDGMESVPVR
ncbi:MAG: hypothetical protein GY835_16000 [bacterium]|nr:hypothetical protein [bacterium]